MDKEEREDAKQALAEINKTLEDEILSAEQRQELEIHAAQLSGFLLSVCPRIGEISLSETHKCDEQNSGKYQTAHGRNSPPIYPFLKV